MAQEKSRSITVCDRSKEKDNHADHQEIDGLVGCMWVAHVHTPSLDESQAFSYHPTLFVD